MPPSGPEPDSRLRELFERAVQLSAAEREALYRQECSGEAELESRLRRMVDADASSTGDILAGGPFARAAPLGRVGLYQLIEEIGEGGTGTVFLAEQQEPIRRTVALKMIRIGMNTDEVVARFEAERQTLAIMEHPGIARIFDGGVTETGRPYFVMEYVPGMPITEYCDHFRLSLEERLELFCTVCRAIQHAHQKGIIHRDLKPGNILVARKDDKAVPKVIDFGIARAVSGSLIEEAMQATGGRIVGTLLYMSPEQADPRAVDVDTRADIYSLGVILYELLAGTRPFELSTGDVDELLRTLRQDDPARPSARLGDMGERTAAIALARRVGRRRLTQELTGDLDWIVMRAIERDRERRYSSASELEADIERHLADEPVSAGPPSTVYRLRKFARRNRVPVTIGVFLVLSLIAGIVGTGTGMRRARAATRAESEMRAEAEQREVSLMGIVRFFNHGLLQALPTELSVREMLAETVPDIGELFEDHPGAEAAVRYQVGKSYLLMGEERRAREQFLAAHTLQKRLSDVPVTDLLATLAALVHTTRTLDGTAAAEAYAGQIRTISMDFVQRRYPLLFEPLTEMLSLLDGERPDGDRARAPLDAVVEAFDATFEPEDPNQVIVLRLIAEVGLALRNWELPEGELYFRALERPRFDVLTVTLVEELLLVWVQALIRLSPESGDDEGAHRHASELVDRVDMLPAQHWLRADSHRLLALSLAKLGRDVEAERELELSLALVREQRYRTTRTLDTLRGPAELLETLKQRGRLEDFLRRSLEEWIEARGSHALTPIWWVVRHPGSSEEVSALVVELVEARPELHETSALASVYGVSLFRAGRVDDALEMLPVADARNGGRSAVDQAFRALAFHQKKDRPAALLELELLRAQAAGADGETRELLAEVERELGL